MASIGEEINIFKRKEGLSEAIREQIFPALVIIDTEKVKGTGYFQHQCWVVSNAHMIPNREDLRTAKFFSYDKREVPIEIEKSFHRPDGLNMAPDVVIINTTIPESNSRRCLLTQFNDDHNVNGVYTFYVDLDVPSENELSIRFLDPIEYGQKHPLIYHVQDDYIPKAGSSGSPIIQARLAIGHRPEWQFCVVGILYARCRPQWLSEYCGIPMPPDPDIKFVCAIPVAQEFSQILHNILIPLDQAKYYLRRALACRMLGDARALLDEQENLYLREIELQKIENGFIDFETGKSSLNILLPRGLEKLFYSKKIGIKQSLLIYENLEMAVKRSVGSGKKADGMMHDFQRSIHFSDFATLRQDFIDFLLIIEREGLIKLSKRNEAMFSPRGYFRMDIGPSKERKEWVVQIQDNTGKDNTLNGKSLSSIFSSVSISNDRTAIKGSNLSKLLLEDYNQTQTNAQERLSLRQYADSVSSAVSMTFTFSPPRQKFTNYFNALQQEGYHFSLWQSEDTKKLYIKCINMPVAVEQKLLKTHFYRLKKLLEKEIKIADKELPIKMDIDGRIMTVEGSEENIRGLSVLLKGIGRSEEPESRFRCTIS